MQGAKKKVRSVSYAKWGYVFIAPFFIVFALFQLYPLVSTIYYSFFEYFFKQGGLIQVGPKFVGGRTTCTFSPRICPDTSATPSSCG